jgi:UDP-N-acetylglucosamine 2-epimerase (non-hydrolysing)
MNICIVVGARPNFIKVAPIIRAIAKAHEEGRDISYKLVFTGKEDDKTIEGSLFDDLQINRPDFYLGVDCDSSYYWCHLYETRSCPNYNTYIHIRVLII